MAMHRVFADSHPSSRIMTRRDCFVVSTAVKCLVETFRNSRRAMCCTFEKTNFCTNCHFEADTKHEAARTHTFICCYYVLPQVVGARATAVKHWLTWSLLCGNSISRE
eukprot:NODE_586_length_6373_cov_0.635480.p6 type:complete len:108 gc:universal NODE_586_length_6373_cov_0.635480:6285-5962(-)